MNTYAKRHFDFWLIMVSAASLLHGGILAADQHDGSPEGMPLADVPKELRFVTALCADAGGCVWVGTEDSGLFRFDPGRATAGNSGSAWARFTRTSTGGQPENDGPVLTTGTPDVNALGDDCVYALACDRLGRIWAGHLNHGVTVFNGEKWRNYDILSGPAGERVFCITTSPVDGDVWIGTSAGITRYSLKDDTWSYVTRADGLPSDQIQSLAFGKDGTIYAGTQCDGIAVCTPTQEKGRLLYRSWRCAAGPYPLPLAAAGTGLPSNLINGLLVGKDGTVYAATSVGLAWSRDQGKTWKFLRGEDWLAKAKGLYIKPDPGKLAKAEKDAPATLLQEDYCTSLAEDSAGDVWVGHRSRSYEAIRLAKDGRTLQRISSGNPDKKSGLYSWCLLPFAGSKTATGTAKAPLLAGCFAENGLRIIRADALTDVGLAPSGARPVVSPLPSPARPLTGAEIDTLVKGLQRPAVFRTPPVYYLGEDWKTWGDWRGRYGKAMGYLCAVMAPISDTYHDDFRCRLEGETIGPNASKGDSLRAWVHWLTTQNRRVLWMEVLGMRREAEWDDHGETYPKTLDGPGIQFKVTVPDGAYCLSLYFFNPNGKEKSPSERDYVVEVAPAEQKALASDSIARTRVCAFAGGGVYKQFMVVGGKSYTVRIQRNNSFNTILNGVFLDRVSGSSPDKVFSYCGNYYKPPAGEDEKEKTIFGKLWDVGSLDGSEKGGTDASHHYLCRLQAFRAANAEKPMDDPLMQRYSWSLKAWTQPLRREFDAVMFKIFWRKQKGNKFLRTKEGSPGSPNTYSTPEEWEMHNQTEPGPPPFLKTRLPVTNTKEGSKK